MPPAVVFRAFNGAQRLWRRIEDVFAGFAACFFAVMGLTAAAMMLFSPPPSKWWEMALRYGGGSTIVILEFSLILTILNCRSMTPFAPHVALNMPRFPLLLRPVIALYWGGHAALMLANLSAGQLLASGASWGLRFGIEVLLALLAFFAFLYVLLALSTLKRDPALVMRTWRGRAWFLIVIVILSFLLPYVGLVFYERDDVMILASQKVHVSSNAGQSELVLSVRNVGNTHVKLLADPEWDDFEVEVTTPSRHKFKLQRPYFGQGFFRSESDYMVLAARMSQETWRLTLKPDLLHRNSSNWQRIGGDGNTATPFAESGEYRIRLTYRDNMWAANEAVGSLGVTICSVVIEK